MEVSLLAFVIARSTRVDFVLHAFKSQGESKEPSTGSREINSHIQSDETMLMCQQPL